jgi:hypothetical protein
LVGMVSSPFSLPCPSETIIGPLSTGAGKEDRS